MSSSERRAAAKRSGGEVMEDARAAFGSEVREPALTLLTTEALAAPGAPCPRVQTVKRVADVALAAAGLVLVAPFVALAAAAIKLDSPGPVFYSQDRVGRDRRRRVPSGGKPDERRREDLGGKPFRIYKLRTMRADAESATGPVWAAKGDDRVTRVGRLLRKSRFDEAPQLWNVLRGEMSLVGPRPERPAFVLQLRDKVPGYRDRLSATKPGLTGLAQVLWDYDSSVEGVRVKVRYDLEYGAAMRSLRTYLPMEARILARTVLVVLTGKGAH